MADPLILYSVNSSLAYNVSRHYYGDKHFVWCTPYFDASPIHGRAYTVPPSSSPAEIYRTYARDIAARDTHSDKIQNNRVGIVRGARAMRRSGVVNAAQYNEIDQIVKLADMADFEPLVFVIPFDKVRHMAKLVPPTKRAHPLSVEYTIQSLPGDWFDIIKF